MDCLPFWLPERAPTWRDDLSGVIHGVRQSTTPLDLFQAITEATYQRLARIADLLPGAKHGLELRVGGGIQKSPASFQRLADCLGRSLIACDEPETSLRGAAVFAAERLGGRIASLGGATVRPRAKPAAAYRVQRRRLLALESRIFS